MWGGLGFEQLCVFASFGYSDYLGRCLAVADCCYQTRCALLVVCCDMPAPQIQARCASNTTFASFCQPSRLLLISKLFFCVSCCDNSAPAQIFLTFWVSARVCQTTAEARGLLCGHIERAVFDKCDVPSGAGAATGFGHSLTTLPQLAAEDSDKASGESAQPVLPVPRERCFSNKPQVGCKP